MLHKAQHSQHEAAFREETASWLVHFNPEQAFDCIARKRNLEAPFNNVCAFVLRHGDLHGRNIIMREDFSGSHSSPRRMTVVINWNFGGSYALPFADKIFEVIYNPEHALAQEQFHW
ncbi:hypothetical protein ID866_7040 [Astraeus odoratus]|nr:hypothetical protein ID866_7040 [Astraeus odoratus]